MADFSCHRPPIEFSWLEPYKEKLGMKQILADYETMYDWLLSKPIGWKYNLQQAKGMTNKDVRDYKIKLICVFITDNNYDFEFNRTFTELKRIKIDVKQKKLVEEGN